MLRQKSKSGHIALTLSQISQFLAHAHYTKLANVTVIFSPHNTVWVLRYLVKSWSRGYSCSLLYTVSNTTFC